jgi:GTP cyclohydrolase I
MTDYKADPELGQKVKEYLTNKGIETPSIPTGNIDEVTHLLGKALSKVGFDLNDDSMKDTPSRVAKMWMNEWFAGLNYNLFPKCTVIENKMHYDEMICETGINVMSCCEHHLATIHGIATVAYIPRQKVIGLSKLNRIVNFFARRPQVQERLTMQIAETLKFVLETQNVAVHINAKHYCVISRGIEDHNSSTSTMFVSGGFRDNPSLKQEFLSSIKG